MKSHSFFVFALISFMAPAMTMASDGLGESRPEKSESILCQKAAMKKFEQTQVADSREAPVTRDARRSGQL